ncbi:alpha/beta hydrolase [uncultured Aquimarina sp.]|uniref:alpha/beta fold hydrolase n=1 Tax=uncultured Aquimarina sp. TaxID=575652 RepID=UPI0026237C53|nr:alpha/beta hydrolase [uncultured Aquimarina sp.]
MKNILFIIVLLVISCSPNTNKEQKTNDDRNIVEQKVTTTFKKQKIDGINIFYREAGDPNKETIVLLHGFPSSSHQYRKVLSELSDDYHLIAPDYPGFGESDFPDASEYEYTFDNIAETIDGLLEKLKLDSYVLMIQDYGAPIGLRIATKHPERVRGIINQNGNAYEKGLGEAWAGVKNLWENRNSETENALLGVFSLEGLKWQYTHGVRNPENINPDTWNLDYARMSRPGAHKVNLDLFYDYQNNIKLYPKWQQYLRENQPPMLIVWGKNDAFFPESGANAFQRDLKNVDINILNTGHFALEEDANIIIPKMRLFMKKL